MQVIVPTSPIGVTMRPMPIPEYHVFIKVSFSNFSRLVPSCLKLFKLVIYVFGYVPFIDSKKNICLGTKKILQSTYWFNKCQRWLTLRRLYYAFFVASSNILKEIKLSFYVEKLVNTVSPFCSLVIWWKP